MYVDSNIKMTTKTTLLILFILTFSSAYGQNPQVKKEIIIVRTFDYNYEQGGRLYLSRTGSVKMDTVITEFNQDGTLKHPYQKPYVAFGRTVSRDSIVLIMDRQNLKHEREYWSDTTSVDIYTQNFGDSIFHIKVLQGDTIQINKSYFHKGNLIKCHNRKLSDSYEKLNEIILFDTKTKNQEIATVITTYFQNGLTDTVRIDNNMKRKVFKTLVYNQDKKEWFEKEKTQLKKSKRVVWETLYHDYHKMYFTTKTTTTYNKFGLPISNTQYDTYLNHFELKTTYEYEYY